MPLDRKLKLLFVCLFSQYFNHLNFKKLIYSSINQTLTYDNVVDLNYITICTNLNYDILADNLRNNEIFN